MWIYRLGLERAKRLLLTGDSLDGRRAVDWGLASEAAPAAELDAAALALARRVALLPANQLHMMKLLVNQAYEQMGLRVTQLIGTLLDGSARHTPEGVAFTRGRWPTAQRRRRARRAVRGLRAGAPMRRALAAAGARGRAARRLRRLRPDGRAAGPHDARRVRPGDRGEGLPGALRPRLRAAAREQAHSRSASRARSRCSRASRRSSNPRLTIGKVTVAADEKSAKAEVRTSADGPGAVAGHRRARPVKDGWRISSLG